MNTYIFYCFRSTPVSGAKGQIYSVYINGLTYGLKILRPTYKNSGGKDFFHLLVWNILSLFRLKEYQLISETGEIASYAQLMPKIFIFRFMQRKGLHIGPCFTIEKYRGRGLYPELLKIIIQNETKCNEFYIFTKTTNIASQKGIVKAGFIPFGHGYKSKFGVYKILQSEKDKSLAEKDRDIAALK